MSGGWHSPVETLSKSQGSCRQISEVKDSKPSTESKPAFSPLDPSCPRRYKIDWTVSGDSNTAPTVTSSFFYIGARTAGACSNTQDDAGCSLARHDVGCMRALLCFSAHGSRHMHAWNGIPGGKHRCASGGLQATP